MMMKSFVLSFWMTPIPFIALDIFSLIWRLKFRALSKYIPKCFCQSAQTTGALLKMIFEWDGLFNFWENITSGACYSNQDWMTFSFYKPFQIFFCRSLFNSFAEILLSCTTENREVSSAKVFVVDTKSSDRSLMSIRKKKSGPRMEPCGTLALTGNHSDVWPFDRTLWNLFYKKLSMRLSRES